MQFLNDTFQLQFIQKKHARNYAQTKHTRLKHNTNTASVGSNTEYSHLVKYKVPTELPNKSLLCANTKARETGDGAQLANKTNKHGRRRRQLLPTAAEQQVSNTPVASCTHRQIKLNGRFAIC